MDKAMKLTGNQFSWAASIFCTSRPGPSAGDPSRPKGADCSRIVPDRRWLPRRTVREGGNEDRALPGLIQFGLLREPAAYLIGRYPAQKVLGITCVLWGVCVISMIGCKNFATAMVNRFFLGAFRQPSFSAGPC